jgi:hypothetical protein
VKKVILLCLSLCFSTTIPAQRALSEKAVISVLTCAPHDEEVFTLYGHAAFRVQDAEQQLDWVFNYGVFDFSKPGFIYRFVKGETDYVLGIVQYARYAAEYQLRGSEITGQTLDLTPDEKIRIWNALLTNAQPENRTYRYNFFFDNCATRLPAMIEKYINGKITYHERPDTLTFRDMTGDCTRGHPWLTFGCDLALGSPTDRIATPHERMFLPAYLKEGLATAVIIAPDGTERPLVAETYTIEALEQDETEMDWLDDIFTPLVCFWLLFLLVAGFTWREWRKKTDYLFLDVALFTVAGLTGVVLFFLCFISEHPCIWPNWLIIWLHPFHLAGAAVFCVKRGKKASYYYHFINFVALTLMLAGWYFIPQHLNVACIPLITILWLRSGYSIQKHIKPYYRFLSLGSS